MGVEPESRSVREDVDLVATASGFISKKWNAAILHVLLAEGPLGFNDLKARLDGVSAKVLSESLEDLGESDLVERRVLSESPLRVEYDLTPRGRDIRPVVEGLLEWADEHLSGERPRAVVADDDPRIADMHGDWLAESYDVETVTEASAAIERAADVDVAVLDRGLSRSDRDLFGRVRDGASAGVVALTSTEPGLDVVELACDAYLTKPVDPEELHATVAAVLDRTEADRDVREYLSLSARRRAIRGGTTPEERSASDAFQRLTDRIDELEGRIDDEGLPAPTPGGGSDP